MDPTSHRLVHLDLKGAPPKIEYYEHLFPCLNKWGATGLLIEYEDMFPYWGDLDVLACREAYSKEDVEKIKCLAKANDLMVMPLVQTFGHFEFVLKHDKFRHLREVPNYPMALCPALEESFNIVCKMIDQVIEMHPGLPWFHIGADEVFHMGKCDRCTSQRHEDIYVQYIKKVAGYIRQRYPGVIPVMWDDVFRGWPQELLKESGLGELVEPMVWNYSRVLHLPPDIWERYSSIFPSIWFASAFKGATGSTMYLTDIGFHCDNHLSWLAVMKDEGHLFRTIRGIALTGWQRYDHYAVLCELLPVSLPCLAMCLHVLLQGSFTPQLHADVSKALQVTELIPMNPFMVVDKLEGGHFPGCAIYRAMQVLLRFNAEYEQFLKDDRLNGWMTPYHIRHNYTNPVHVEHILHGARRVHEQFQEILMILERELTFIFYKDTVEEWLDINVVPKVKQIAKIVRSCVKQIEIGGRVRNHEEPMEAAPEDGQGF